MREVAEDEQASSIHFLFCTDAEKEVLSARGYFPRLSMQFHWHNRPGRPFESFDDYLSTFRSQNRKQVRKERRVAAEHGLTFRTATGAELETRDWTALRAFYVENVDRHGGHAYLSAAFFEIARETLGHRLVATLAYQGKKPVAGTINFEKGAHLYGRYWGCLADFQMLHFELCYYQLIERAIAQRQTLFEAGAQGEHKLKRGLAPAFTHSAHWIRHPDSPRRSAHSWCERRRGWRPRWWSTRRTPRSAWPATPSRSSQAGSRKRTTNRGAMTVSCGYRARSAVSNPGSIRVENWTACANTTTST